MGSSIRNETILRVRIRSIEFFRGNTFFPSPNNFVTIRFKFFPLLFHPVPSPFAGMRATKARLILKRSPLIIPDWLYAHAPVSLARGFFRRYFSPRERRVKAVRVTFFTRHHRLSYIYIYTILDKQLPTFNHRSFTGKRKVVLKKVWQKYNE